MPYHIFCELHVYWTMKEVHLFTRFTAWFWTKDWLVVESHSRSSNCWFMSWIELITEKHPYLMTWEWDSTIGYFCCCKAFKMRSPFNKNQQLKFLFVSPQNNVWPWKRKYTHITQIIIFLLTSKWLLSATKSSREREKMLELCWDDKPSARQDHNLTKF